MPYVTVGRENAGDIEFYYKDWGSGHSAVFSHGWPLSADAWEDQMFFVASHGYRCITHDRCDHGRSSQPWNGNDDEVPATDEVVQAMKEPRRRYGFTKMLMSYLTPQAPGGKNLMLLRELYPVSGLSHGVLPPQRRRLRASWSCPIVDRFIR